MPKKKYVRFSLYKAVLSLTDNHADKLLKADQRIAELEAIAPQDFKSHHGLSLDKWRDHRRELAEAAARRQTTWQLSQVIEAAQNGRIPEMVLKVNGEKIEMDRNAYFHKDSSPHLYSFQIAKLRATGLPAKKKIDEAREDIPLAEDEYIGEFTEILLDTRYGVVIIQSNKYGVGVSAVQKYLNFLQKQYLEINRQPVNRYLVGELQPILDEGLTERALAADCYKKVRIRCSDVNKDGIIPEDSVHLSSVARIIGEQTGVTLDVCLTVKREDAAGTLTARDVRSVARKYREFMAAPTTTDEDKKDARVEVTILNPQTNVLEAIDLLTPKVDFLVPIEVEERQPIGSEYLYDLTAEQYSRLDARLFAILGGLQ
ncbi:MAG: hypothetical protein J6K32_05385 [Clostridia bacterium]|nr:hypothetical protein [Clostridia bacterium]